MRTHAHAALLIRAAALGRCLGTRSDFALVQPKLIRQPLPRSKVAAASGRASAAFNMRRGSAIAAFVSGSVVATASNEADNEHGDDDERDDDAEADARDQSRLSAGAAAGAVRLVATRLVMMVILARLCRRR